MPNVGDSVFIRPTMPRVLADAHSGRFLSDEGESVTWSAHLAERFKHGEIAIGNPKQPPFRTAPTYDPARAGEATLDSEVK